MRGLEIDPALWTSRLLAQTPDRSTSLGEHRFNTHDHQTRTPKSEYQPAVIPVSLIVSKTD